MMSIVHDRLLKENKTKPNLMMSIVRYRLLKEK